MRTILAAALVIFALPRLAIADTISPGIEFEAARKTLEKLGYEVNSTKYGLRMASRDKDVELEFCRIDTNITLIISYNLRTKNVTSLELIFIPDAHTSKDGVIREAREMTFEDDGTYTVKLKRKADRPQVAK